MLCSVLLVRPLVEGLDFSLQDTGSGGRKVMQNRHLEDLMASSVYRVQRAKELSIKG